MIMLLSVEGVPKPWQRLVSAENMDEAYELIGLTRVLVLRDLIRDLEEVSHENFKDLKVKIKDTGLLEYPETEEEINSVIERMNQ